MNKITKHFISSKVSIMTSVVDQEKMQVLFVNFAIVEYSLRVGA